MGNLAKRHGLRCVDLFCGAGGLSLGFQLEGFTSVLAVDQDPDAVDTYRRNLGGIAERFDLSIERELPPADVILGGPPCQGFSSAGLRMRGDDRNSLISTYASIVVRHRPQAFVFENVEGFLTAEGGVRLFELLHPLVAAGYHIHIRKVNAANYGIPQHRKRVLAVGGLGWAPAFPEPTHFAYGAPGAELIGGHLPPCPTVGEALQGLPEAGSEPPGKPEGHYFRPLSDRDIRRASELEAGQTMKDLSPSLQHSSYRRRANRRVRDGTPMQNRGGAPAGIRRLEPNAPSKSITGAARAELLHPFEDRNLTLRECARLQTFPDEFVFSGSVTKQTQLIGNAVPPQLGRALARVLKRDIKRRSSSDAGNGRVVSFVPTHASGMSPALRRVTTRVEEEFNLVATGQIPLWS